MAEQEGLRVDLGDGMTWQNSLFSGITVGKVLCASALSTDARMAVATAAEHSHYRRGWLDSGDVKRIKKSETEVEVVLGSLGALQDAQASV